MITPKPLVTEAGIDVGSSNRNLTYLYGISDFFSFIFEDTTHVNLMLEANAFKASEIYSRFLQLTSSFSLTQVQEQVGSGIELILITTQDVVPGPNSFRIQKPFSSAMFLSNRPFLPTELLEHGVDFRVTQESISSCIVQFSKPIEEYQFSKRILSTGQTQYALWFTDVAVDESLMYKNYGHLLGIEPEVSSEQFSNFIYGLYYLYLNGPTLKVMEQGLNLVLGIPIPREIGYVLDIRVDTETGRYLVITANQKYVLPGGVTPDVGIGDLVTPQTFLTKWIELKDYISDGKWWLNVSIPPNLIRATPVSQTDRFAKEGNRFDYLMSNYLYRNTFLVRINVGTFRDTAQYFRYLPDIISRGKPASVQPVFVWRIDMGEEEVGRIEEFEFTVSQIISRMTYINAYPINDYLIN